MNGFQIPVVHEGAFADGGHTSGNMDFGQAAGVQGVVPDDGHGIRNADLSKFIAEFKRVRSDAGHALFDHDSFDIGRIKVPCSPMIVQLKVVHRSRSADGQKSFFVQRPVQIKPIAVSNHVSVRVDHMHLTRTGSTVISIRCDSGLPKVIDGELIAHDPRHGWI